ncbi:MAG TPA: hypothetical protein VMO17_21485 [Terriglobia bacterium]|nr:hypothetical protein [Terriglobia bacterium]
MDLFLLGVAMGAAGGLLPSPLQMIALTQVAIGRWGRAIFVLMGPSLIVDGAFLVLTFFFVRLIPLGIVHNIGYLGGTVLIGFATYTLIQIHRKTEEEMASSAGFTLAGVVVAEMAEVAAPGTWVYWLTIAGPILAEGRVHGYGHVVPFFVGGAVGFYGAAVFATALISWGARLHKRLKQHLVLAANILLLLMGITYLVRAYFG